MMVTSSCRFVARLLSVSLLFTAACGGEAGDAGVDDGDGGTSDESDTGDGDAWDGTWPTLDCDPLVPTYCAFPLPNNVFTVADPQRETGLRTQFDSMTVPVSNSGGVTDVTPFNTRDGFSPGINMVTHLPGATAQGLPRPDSIEDSLSPSSPTILLDVETGALVPHWSEIDMSTADDERRAFLIRPAVRLDDAKRYIVAIRDVVDGDGEPIAPSEGFLALRDDSASDDPAINDRRDLYDNIFRELEDAGVPRDDLQLAWDFTTASRDDTTAWMLHMRDVALEMTPASGPSYLLDSVTPNWAPGIAFRVEGHVEVPLFLDDPGPGGMMRIGDDGLPRAESTAMYPFLALIPESAGTEPAALLQFGHGLFGTYTQVEGTQTIATDYNLVTFGVDWIGMSSEDPVQLLALLSSGDLSNFATLPDRLLQAQVNALLTMRMMMGDFKDDPQLQVNGQSPIDAEERYYAGGSLGGILGSVYMAITPDVQRGGLMVPGQSFNLLLSRSVLFQPFFDVLQLNYDDPLDIPMFLATAMLLWDRAEPTGFTPYLRSGALTDGFKHEVLIQGAMGDHQVTNYGTHLMSRAIDAPPLVTSGEYFWGMDPVEDGHEGSATIMYDFGLPPIPLENVPMEEGDDPHASILLLPGGEGLTTLDTFLRTGAVINACDGVCDPD
jgi:hypothetical protein